MDIEKVCYVRSTSFQIKYVYLTCLKKDWGHFSLLCLAEVSHQSRNNKLKDSRIQKGSAQSAGAVENQTKPYIFNIYV